MMQREHRNEAIGAIPAAFPDESIRDSSSVRNLDG